MNEETTEEQNAEVTEQEPSRSTAVIGMSKGATCSIEQYKKWQKQVLILMDSLYFLGRFIWFVFVLKFKDAHESFLVVKLFLFYSPNPVYQESFNQAFLNRKWGFTFLPFFMIGLMYLALKYAPFYCR